MRPKRNPPVESVRRVQHIDNNSISTLTNKTGRTIQTEAFSERKLLLLLERDKAVKDYITQPEKIEFVDQKGKRRTYIPDVKVWFTNGKIRLCEVTRKERREEKLSAQEREVAGKMICEARGWEYLVYDEDVLPNDTVVANLLSVYGLRAKGYRDAEAADRILEYLCERQPMHIVTLEQEIVDLYQLNLAIVNMTLFNLLWHGELETDWNHLLFFEVYPTKSAQVWLANYQR